MAADNEESLDDEINPLQIVADFLTQAGWPCEQVGEEMLLKSAFKGNSGQWICYAHYRPHDAQTLFYSVAPLLVPAVLRLAVAEYVTRANWGLLSGNFELDYSDGEVRFKSGIQLGTTRLTADLLRPLIMGNVAVMDKYLPGIQAVVALQQTPSEAIASVEGG